MLETVGLLVGAAAVIAITLECEWACIGLFGLCIFLLSRAG